MLILSQTTTILSNTESQNMHPLGWDALLWGALVYFMKRRFGGAGLGVGLRVNIMNIAGSRSGSPR